MNIPTDALGGSPTFSINCTKLPDGTYEASAPGTAVQPTKGATEGEAIRAQSLALWHAITKGECWPTSRKSDA